jgi:acetyl esterase/lipase
VRTLHRRVIALLGLFVVLAAMVLAPPRARGIARRVFFPLWVQTDGNLAYGPNAVQRLDILRPRSVVATRPRPAVVVFHGGGWSSGTRLTMVDPVCRRYLAHGFVVVNVDYRLGAIQTAADDARLALSWFLRNAAHYGADCQRVVVTGHSAGGHLALLAGFHSEQRIAAIINFYGPSDLTQLVDRPTYRAVLPSRNWIDAASRLSPITYVRAGLPPVLSIHGTADQVVPPEQTVRLTGALSAAGVEASVFYVRNAGHGLSPEDADAAYREVFAFLRRRGVMVSQ